MFTKFLRNLALGSVLGSCVFAVHATDLTFFETQRDTDWTSTGVSGVSGRNNSGDGTADISLTGTSGTITQAYLYWHGPSNDSNSPETVNSDINFAGTDISGDFLGISSDNCWGFANSVAYRADVTSLVSGDGTYTVTDYLTSSSTADTNGFSLVVFFDDGDDTNNRDVVMFDGNDSNISNPFDANGWNILLEDINYASGDADMELHVADGQSFSDDALVVNSTTIEPAGAVFQGDTLPIDGTASSGGLWDIRDFDVTSLLSPGLNDLQLTTGQSSDCLACVLIAIDLPAGAAPPDPDDPPTGVPAPASAFLLLSGLALLGRQLRKRA